MPWPRIARPRPSCGSLPPAPRSPSDLGARAGKYSRHIPQAPERILDAPELLDDYYLNLLDWNAENILGARTRTAAPGVPGSPRAPPY